MIGLCNAVEVLGVLGIAVGLVALLRAEKW